jgi:heme/copper-type cytochrome/quinol oxidase subunit 2
MRKRYCKALRGASSLPHVHAHSNGNPLAEVIFWIAAAVCIIAELALLRSAFMPRSTDEANLSHPARGGEMLWAVIPAVGLMFLLAATWRAVNH